MLVMPEDTEELALTLNGKKRKLKITLPEIQESKAVHTIIHFSQELSPNSFSQYYF